MFGTNVRRRQESTMLRSYSIRIAWERFDFRKAILAVILVLSCCFTALFITAKPAVAEKKQTNELHKYYTSITVQQGDTLWAIAEDRLADKQTSGSYKSTRSYMKEIIALNNLKDGNYLLAGQKLIVPYYSSEYKN